MPGLYIPHLHAQDSLPYRCPRCGDAASGFSSLHSLRAHFQAEHAYCLPRGARGAECSGRSSPMTSLFFRDARDLERQLAEARDAERRHKDQLQLLANSAAATPYPTLESALYRSTSGLTELQAADGQSLGGSLKLSGALGSVADQRFLVERLREQLSFKDAQLTKASGELRRLTGDRLRLQRDVLDLSRGTASAEQRGAYVDGQISEKDRLIDAKQQEIAELHAFVRDTAVQETAARAQLEHYIEALLQRAEKAERRSVEAERRLRENRQFSGEESGHLHTPKYTSTPQTTLTHITPTRKPPEKLRHHENAPQDVLEESIVPTRRQRNLAHLAASSAHSNRRSHGLSTSLPFDTYDSPHHRDDALSQTHPVYHVNVRLPEADQQLQSQKLVRMRAPADTMVERDAAQNEPISGHLGQDPYGREIQTSSFNPTLQQRFSSGEDPLPVLRQHSEDAEHWRMRREEGLEGDWEGQGEWGEEEEEEAVTDSAVTGEDEVSEEREEERDTDALSESTLGESASVRAHELSTSSASRRHGADKREYDWLFCVFRCLDTFSLTQVSRVCKTWRTVARDPALWRRLVLANHRLSAQFLCNLSTWCTQVVSLTLEGVKPRSKTPEESPEQYEQNIRGSLETGLEWLLRANTDSLLTLRIVDCGELLTDRCLWLASCYSRRLERLAYLSDTYPAGLEVLYALGAGCRNITTLIIPPMYPNARPHKFSNKCASLIGRCWPGMRVLCVGGVEVDQRGLATIARSCPVLEVLELDHMCEVTEAAVRDMCAAGLKNLTSIDFTFTPVTPKAVKQLKDCCKRLRMINIHIGISDYYEDTTSAENARLYAQAVAKLKALRSREDMAGVLHIKSDYG